MANLLTSAIIAMHIKDQNRRVGSDKTPYTTPSYIADSTSQTSASSQHSI